MGLNAFALFTGFGLGSILFQMLLSLGFPVALSIFAAAELLLAALSTRWFQSESPSTIAETPQ